MQNEVSWEEQKTAARRQYVDTWTPGKIKNKRELQELGLGMHTTDKKWTGSYEYENTELQKITK